ncbi:Asp-tRNA(Asn)/Glu-tRNA(Gln) amidotransferase GatCAB subunit A [Mycolicibacterium goodii]|uniref:Asp-tRNA(Asn)/Glu-tRNA(Gln) amidotransferase GatCAB subunit A n=1 Tax=Mycolicibacterium goodii TaxID=134601 RepID=A0ABS6HNJ9_MYCGD|nr:Asp-tRNA(Asn)/Glu-tRNA(Gln) amidotransferase GatCAB subunit A [Mycolicibacterium goodii]OKH75750.1 amidase [Mycobacterium sp. SWH-M5]MBU8824234.1 Asp-tRNA(Asn)/Glu-tRNA(Gln) amidotransferase GatCAB subunit A [Mycolicibacterium goodii]MBU8831297.1 Asp-tRNA(Asn)/Glu-tRNA(Gln) amidotransferase GatCAB subunit A [Mycolicibacterium goodii]MBU8837982.1 Asp-tRNA(Asn)/Glu-tRNA(Gln) amidotransferase GatCAB subunit A [Mycolicibacterium goodii]ULN48764.1 Asp-tRNA(Asn)/Glu-tRNA(Gln) amidotransferase Gat
MELYELPLIDIAEKIRTREVSPVEVAESSLARLEEVEPVLTAFATVTPEVALEQAKIAEQEIADGKYRGPLHGIPLGVKDLYDTAGIKTTSSSAQRADYIPDADSASVAKLYDAGMILIGKTHTHEFAYGATTPTTGNPWAPDRTPGGSSGGSGAAVAAGVVHVALGSDTGGSIRIPAALCGTVGLKPTYGRASRVGVASLSWSLDHVGPLSRNVTDSALVMAAMSGYDRRDPGTADVPVPDMVSGIDAGVAGKKIGIPVNYFTDQVAPEAAEAARVAAAKFSELGAELVEVEIPLAEHIVPTEWAIMMPEATAYHQDYLRNSPEQYTDEVRTLLEVGAVQPATDYVNALRRRTLIQAAWKEMFVGIDVLLAPTVVAPATLRSDPFVRWDDGTVEAATAAYVRLSAPANVTGLPSLSVPAAFTSDGLPLGVQIIGKPFAEPEILTFGYALEQNTDAVGRIAPVLAKVG